MLSLLARGERSRFSSLPSLLFLSSLLRTLFSQSNVPQLPDDSPTYHQTHAIHRKPPIMLTEENASTELWSEEPEGPISSRLRLRCPSPSPSRFFLCSSTSIHCCRGVRGCGPLQVEEVRRSIGCCRDECLERGVQGKSKAPSRRTRRVEWRYVSGGVPVRERG